MIHFELRCRKVVHYFLDFFKVSNKLISLIFDIDIVFSRKFVLFEIQYKLLLRMKLILSLLLVTVALFCVVRCTASQYRLLVYIKKKRIEIEKRRLFRKDYFEKKKRNAMKKGDERIQKENQ